MPDKSYWQLLTFTAKRKRPQLYAETFAELNRLITMSKIYMQ